MTPLRRFLNVLAVVVPHLPAGHALFRIEAARRILAGEEIDSVARALGVSLATAKRQATVLRRGSIQAVVGRQRRATPETVDAQRFRLAQLLLGALTEERFEREKEELTSGRLIIEDHRLGRTDTDYRVLNGGRKPIFRINIKFHGTAFQQARERVGLDPEDCFALATYKIHQALVRQREEALPYVFLVLSCLGITARSVSALIPEDFAWFVAVATRFGKRDIEEAIVALLLTETYRPVLEDVRQRIGASEFRVLSARKAEQLLKEKLFDRVFALRQRAFTAAYRNAEIDMHLSLRREMVPVREFLAAVVAESPQRLTVLLDRGELA
ncbi:MAG: hypothetical protein ACREM3_24450 [Candidatus Rokuibacteriota bacterium]